MTMRALHLFAPVLVAALAACGDNLTYVTETAPGATVLSCTPNLDGVLATDEVPVVLDAQARFRVASGALAVNLDGVVGSDGRRRFDFAGSYPGDRYVGISGTAIANRWYSASFPGAEFVAPIDVEGALDGIYSRAADGLRLHGFASPTEEPSEGKTLLIYDTPALVLALPLRVGTTWVSTARVVGGTLRGQPYAGTDRYESVVAGTGELRLPALTFASAFEVRTKVTASPSSGSAVVRRQAGFYAECFGEVARATSGDNEESASFTTASEVRRFTP
jgi:hypothetical protein